MGEEDISQINCKKETPNTLKNKVIRRDDQEEAKMSSIEEEMSPESHNKAINSSQNSAKRRMSKRTFSIDHFKLRESQD